MTAKHTAEPWKVIVGMTVDLHRRHIAECGCELGVYARQDVREEEMRPNAQRIVACVNACEGVNPEAVPMLLEACEAVVETQRRADRTGKTFVYVDCETQALSKCTAAVTLAAGADQ